MTEEPKKPGENRTSIPPPPPVYRGKEKAYPVYDGDNYYNLKYTKLRDFIIGFVASTVIGGLILIAFPSTSLTVFGLAVLATIVAYAYARKYIAWGVTVSLALALIYSIIKFLMLFKSCIG